MRSAVDYEDKLSLSALIVKAELRVANFSTTAQQCQDSCHNLATILFIEATSASRIPLSQR
jgi:hypothetical protein